MLTEADPGPMVRDRRSVANCPHWAMEMAFRDGERRVQTNRAAENPATLNHIEAHPARRTRGRDPSRLRLKTGEWDDDCVESLIAP